MSTDKKDHPIRRIREALAQLPDRSRMAEVKHFSKWVGCSESLIRNVENGVTPMSEKLAKSIEDRTGVSAKWLLNSPKPDDPILDWRGRRWIAGRLDPFSYLPNLERLLAACPTLVPAIVAKLVEAQMLYELHSDGAIGTLKRILRILDSHDFFEDSKAGPHPLGSLGRDNRAEETKDRGINLLMNLSPTPTADEIRELEFLRASEPDIPAGSRLPEIYTGPEAKRRRRAPKPEPELD